MKLTRKELRERLTADGIPAENIDALIDDICDANSTSVNAVRNQHAPAAAVTHKAGAQNEGEDWEAKYNALKAENDARDAKKAKEDALKAMLEDSKLSDKGKEKVLKYTNLDDIELDASGKVKGAKKLIDSIHEEWSDYVTEEGTEGTGTEVQGTGASNNGSSVKMTREEIMKITDAGKRQAAIAENHELFGF